MRSGRELWQAIQICTGEQLVYTADNPRADGCGLGPRRQPSHGCQGQAGLRIPFAQSRPEKHPHIHKVRAVESPKFLAANLSLQEEWLPGVWIPSMLQ